ncbi:MAG: hypothetical protein ACJAQ4_001265 [Cryomorphaceae bacterium]|jgi:hypothetical protein
MSFFFREYRRIYFFLAVFQVLGSLSGEAQIIGIVVRLMKGWVGIILWGFKNRELVRGI